MRKQIKKDDLDLMIDSALLSIAVCTAGSSVPVKFCFARSSACETNHSARGLGICYVLMT